MTSDAAQFGTFSVDSTQPAYFDPKLRTVLPAVASELIMLAPLQEMLFIQACCQQGR